MASYTSAVQLKLFEPFKGLLMPIALHERLQCGAAVLQSLDARRARINDPVLHQQLELNIISRELEELAQEWRSNPAPTKTSR